MNVVAVKRRRLLNGYDVDWVMVGRRRCWRGWTDDDAVQKGQLCFDMQRLGVVSDWLKF
jgi:hypothetical protein